MRYEDFAVEFCFDESGCHRVRVRHSSAGEDSARIEVPEPEVAGTVDSGPPETEDALYQQGQRLCSLLLPSPVRSLFDSSRGALQSKSHGGLRIKLHIDPTDRRVRRLAALPWETLCLPSTALRPRYLLLDRRFSLVRYLEVPEPRTPPQFETPLRILAVAPKPRGVSDLDLESECRSFLRAWERVGDVEPELLGRPTRDDLRAAVSTFRPHVLHYIGHGSFDPHTGWGRIYLEDKEGGVDPVSENDLVDLLRGLPSLRLAVLNGCDTGRSSKGGDPGFTGLAPSLVANGLPAVIAMHYPISNRAAVAFSAALFEKLAQGAVVDEAVTEGRIAIRQSIEGSREWVTPVLYMRIADGRLFGDAPGLAEDVLDATLDVAQADDVIRISNVDQVIGSRPAGPGSLAAAHTKLKVREMKANTIEIANRRSKPERE